MSLRLAMIGVWHSHAPGKAQCLRDLPDLDLAGIYEPDPEVISERRAREQFAGATWVGAPDDLLADNSVAGIIIDDRVTSNLHWCRLALEAGKHVLLEKPAGTDLQEFRRLSDLARRDKLVLQMGYQFRYTRAFECLRAIVKDGLIGEVFFFRGRIGKSISAYEHLREEQREYPGGMFFELACHLLDTAVDLLGAPARVTSFLRTDGGDDPEFTDNAAAVLEYGRAMAVIETAAMESDGHQTRRLEVYGNHGTVILTPIHPCPILRVSLDRDQPPYRRGWQDVEVGERTLFEQDLREFAACIGGKQPEYDSDHDLAVQETLLRICRPAHD